MNTMKFKIYPPGVECIEWVPGDFILVDFTHGFFPFIIKIGQWLRYREYGEFESAYNSEREWLGG